MTNIELIQIEILNQIIYQIDLEDLEAARDTAVRFRGKHKSSYH